MTPYLHYQRNKLLLENFFLADVAKKFGTPCYLYSRTALEKNWRDFDNAFSGVPHRICYAVKANSNIAILNIFAKLNSGFDIVSQGELERVILAGGQANKIIFSGVGKKSTEIERAIKLGIYCFNIESAQELERLSKIAGHLNREVNVVLRVNPNIDPCTHAHISTGLEENKFGIRMRDVIPLCQKLSTWRHLRLIGIAFHIGSQILSIKPFLLALDRLLAIYKKLQALNIYVQHLNIGGGLGITYHNEKPPRFQTFANAIKKKLAGYPVEIIVEPGRALVGNAGVLITEVEYIKQNKNKNFAIVDVAMNDFLRPALYDAWQNILPVVKHSHPQKKYDIVGPICESADFLGKNRKLALRVGDLLVIDSVGAYGFCMSSNYNSRVRAPEILLSKNQLKLIRQRESFEDLVHLEKMI